MEASTPPSIAPATDTLERYRLRYSRRPPKMEFTKHRRGERRHAFLLYLPRELLLLIVDAIFEVDTGTYDGISWEAGYLEPQTTYTYPFFDRFDVWKDVARTCKDMYACVTPVLHKKDVRYNSSSALLLSAKYGNASAIVKSLESGAYIDEYDFTEFLVDYNYEENRDDGERRSLSIEFTALQLASYHHHHADCVDVLLRRGADITRRRDPGDDEDDERFLGYPTKCLVKHFEPYIERYSERSTSSGSRQRKDVRGCGIKLPVWIRWFMLSDAANCLYYALTDSYRGHWGAYSFVFSEKGHARRRNDRVATVRLLLQAGVSTTTQTKCRINALHQSCGNMDPELATLFLQETDAGANVRDRLGNTPLHYLAMCFSLDNADVLRSMVRLLVQHGADVDAVNLAGVTPFQTGARRHPCVDLVAAFTESGARMPRGLVSDMRKTRTRYKCDANIELDKAIAAAVERGEEADEETTEIMPDEEEEGGGGETEDLEARAVYMAIYMAQHEDDTEAPSSSFVDENMTKWNMDEWKAYWESRNYDYYSD